jgi:aminoglycoside phosphotransferase (APT) family kinase protein
MSRRLASVACCSVALAAVAALPAAATPVAQGHAVESSGPIDLRIVYRATDTAAAQLLTLRCDPARGTVPHPAAACRQLRALGADAFAPTPRGMGTCAQLYGGPMTAIVAGVYEGRHVWTRLSRVDGCKIARWTRVAFLLPPVPAAKPGRAPGS